MVKDLKNENNFEMIMKQYKKTISYQGTQGAPIGEITIFTEYNVSTVYSYIKGELFGTVVTKVYPYELQSVIRQREKELVAALKYLSELNGDSFQEILNMGFEEVKE